MYVYVVFYDEWEFVCGKGINCEGENCVKGLWDCVFDEWKIFWV